MRSLLFVMAVLTTSSCFLRGIEEHGCTSDDQCRSQGDFCVNGLCVECRSAQDCKDGFVCNGTRCVTPESCASADGGLPCVRCN